MTSKTLAPFRDAVAAFGPPVVVFNKSHSGSRMLAHLLHDASIFMGAHRNDSWDSLDVLPLVEYLVTRYYPGYEPLFDADGPVDDVLATLLSRTFERHLEGLVPGQRWGWKLCETAYILPILAYCFPDAKYVHLIRDGRDVAFCDHHAPNDALWRKVYFNTDRIRTVQGIHLTGPAYRRRSYLFNAIHWVNSVRIGRSYGAMLGSRYREVRYEDFCTDFQAESRKLMSYLEVDAPAATVNRFGSGVYASSIGKYRRYPASWQRQVLSIEKPLLLELGYLSDDPEPRAAWPWNGDLVDRFLDRWHRRRPLVERTDAHHRP